MNNNNVKLQSIGQTDACPSLYAPTRSHPESLAQNTGTTLTLALSYGGRTELVDAVRGIAEKARDGEIDPAKISEQTISGHLYTSDMPDPDLLIRTSGEMRVSNFLLWQISYAELVVTTAFGRPVSRNSVRRWRIRRAQPAVWKSLTPPGRLKPSLTRCRT